MALCGAYKGGSFEGVFAAKMEEEEEEEEGGVGGGGGEGEEGEGERGGGEGEVVEMRVLVVDDSPVDRRMVEGLIKRSGRGMFQVITVDSGKKAMEVLGLNNGRTDSIAASEQKIDVILTDYCMPEMSGFDLLKAVRERSSPKPIPVVIMSSENEPQRINRCRAVGAADFILKPLQSKDVQRLRDSVTSTPLAPKNASSKRKMPMDLMAEKSGSERRPRLAGVAVA